MQAGRQAFKEFRPVFGVPEVMDENDSIDNTSVL
jgi:hypothetical protein